MTVLITLFVNHSLFEDFSKIDQKNIVYTDLEKLRIDITTSTGSIFMVIQFIYAISIIVRGDKKGLHDTQSKTITV